MFFKFLIPRLTYSVIYLCIRMCLHVCILIWRFERFEVAMDVYLNGLPPYFLRQGSLTGLDQLAMGPRDPPSPAPQG